MELSKKLAIIVPTSVAAAGIIVTSSVFGVNKCKTGSFNPKNWSCYGDANKLYKKLEKYSHRDSLDASVEKAFEAFEQFVKNRGKGVFTCSYRVAGNIVTYDFDYKSDTDKCSNVLTGRHAVGRFMELYGDDIEEDLVISSALQQATLPGVPKIPGPPPPPPVVMGISPSGKGSPKSGSPVLGFGDLAAARGKLRKTSSATATATSPIGKGSPKSGSPVPSLSEVIAGGKKLRKTSDATVTGTPSNNVTDDDAHKKELFAAVKGKHLRTRSEAASTKNDFSGVDRTAFEAEMAKIENSGRRPALKLSKNQGQWEIVLCSDSVSTDDSRLVLNNYGKARPIDLGTRLTVWGVTFERSDERSTMALTVFEKK